jgi:hypothetical protein
LKFVTATIQREEIRRNVMNHETHSGTVATCGYHVKTMPCNENFRTGMSEHLFFFLIKTMANGRSFQGKRSELKCNCCHITGYLIDRCWQLHPEIKPKFFNEQKGH